MKRRFLKPLVCILLVVSMLLAPLSALAASKAYILKVNTSGVRLRDSDGSVITELGKGTKVLYWGKTKNGGAMCKVVTRTGKTGYVYKSFLTSYGAVKKSAVYVTKASTPLYKRSGSSLKKSSTLSAGEYLIVYRTSGRWAYVMSMSGKRGYVYKSFVKKAF